MNEDYNNNIVGHKDAIFDSEYCDEVVFNQDCITEVTFLRNDADWSDYGIVGMSYKTQRGKTGSVGIIPTEPGSEKSFTIP